MEKNKKVLKNYVMIVGGSRGEFEDVVVESELSIEEYLKGVGDEEIEGLIESCINEEEVEGMKDYIDEMRIGFIEKYDSSEGFEVYGMCLGEESSVLMFEGSEEIIEDVEDWDEIYDCLGIFC